MHIIEPSGYKDFVWAVEIHRLGFEIMGLWPKNDKFDTSNLWLKLRVGIFLSLIVFVIIIPMILTVIQVWGNLVLVVDNLRIALSLTMSLIKYIILLWKRTVLLSIINVMAEDWMAFKSNTERTVMIKQAQTARVIMVIGYFIMIIGILGAVVPAFFGMQMMSTTNRTDQHKTLLFVTYDLYDTDKSPQYELTFCIHTISFVIGALAFMSVDCFLLLLVLHICGQLKNFRRRLVNMTSCKNYNEILNNIVTSHLRMIRFADNIENTYTLIMLIVVLHFVIVFCLSGFCLILEMDEGTTAKICFSIIMLIVLLMNTFLYCGAGELLTEQCNAVYRAMCNLEWYKLESRKARNLILLMIRARHPVCITAGKIIPLTMATFSSVLKTSCGYITFLLAKRD
ncbi:odorant receptor 43a-like [Solenopsis invicta]|uniref:odorant receptor 43a-like n=1 Tax=Solenopsis invicta TaxID=13686 RepID=UPI00193DADD5|nr:odorant receptor 43a-like [Solenopsis invicta]XP_039307795.1 odorant receptor 43a-like [Solenopsis invicta]XP_039307796.1 odorant receptor 43a-like [Solenopsis invicta]